jgi:hypothetical protein
MSLIWHIAAKDVRRSWPAILAWTVAAAAAVAISSVPTDSMQRVGVQFLLQGALFFLTTFLCYNVFVQQVLEDPLCQPNAFWLTRPISGWRLFSAKLVACALASVPTVLVVIANITRTTGGILENGLGALAPVVIWIALPCLAALVVGSISRTARECLLISILLCVLVSGLSSALQNSRSSSPTPMDLDYARATLGGVLTMAIGLAIVLNQYLTRNRRRSVVLSVLGAGIVLFVTAAWPYSWPEPHLEAEHNADAFSNVQVTPLQLSRTDRTQRNVSVTLQLTGVPPGVVATMPTSKHEWTWSENTPPISCWFESDAPSLKRSLKLHPALKKEGQAPTPTTCSVEGVAPAQVVSSPFPFTKYSVTTAIALWEYSITREFPAKAGTDLRDGALRIKIAESSKERSTLVVSLTAPRATAGQLTEYAIINRRLDRPGRGISWREATPLSGVNSHRLNFEVTESDADFWRDATLVEVTFKRVAVIHRTVETTDLRLNERK